MLMEVNSENILLRIRVKLFYTSKLESSYYLKQYSPKLFFFFLMFWLEKHVNYFLVNCQFYLLEIRTSQSIRPSCTSNELPEDDNKLKLTVTLL